MSSTILCAQDDRQLHKIHEQALAAAGYRVVSVHDGEEALRSATEEGLDLVLLDTSLPKRDGVQVVEAIRALGGPAGQVPALLLGTGRVTPGLQEKLAALGSTRVLAKPVELETLLAHVGRLVKRAPMTVQAHKASAGPAAGPPLAGSLRETDFAKLLHQLHGHRASGVLVVENGKKKKAVQLRDGYPVAVKSNLITECLGSMLVHWGEASETAIDESVQRVKRGEGLQGEILVAMEVLSEEGVSRALRRQAEAKLFEVFTWRRGRYRLEVGARLQNANSLALDANPANVILVGARKHVPIERIDAMLARHGDRILCEGQSPFYRFQSVDLSAADERVISSLDGRQRLAAFVGAEEPVRRTLYGLLATELLVLRGDANRAVEPPRRAREAVTAPTDADEAGLRAELTRTAQGMRDRPMWEVLGLTTTATSDEVRAAYEDLSRRFHPDRFHNASGSVRQLSDEIYGLITRAYEAMADSNRRTLHVESLKETAEQKREREQARRLLAAETAFQQGEAAMRRRAYEEALLGFGQAMERYPEEGEYHAHYGYCLHLCYPDDESILGEAIEHVQRGVKLARDRDKPYLFLGRLYKVMGRLPAAEKMFTRAVQIRPESVEGMRELRLMTMRSRKSKGILGRLLKR